MLLIAKFRRHHAYRFPLILLASLLLGMLTGYFFKERVLVLKPLGDIFINLLFTLVIPLVFFSVAAAIASMKDLEKMWKVLLSSLAVFLFTSVIAGLFMLIVVAIFPLGQSMSLHFTAAPTLEIPNLTDQLVHLFTVTEFGKLFSRGNMLALIFFAFIIGLASAQVGEKGKAFSHFLQAGADVCMKAVSFVMYYAPIGFFAYFAVLTSEMGPRLVENYYRATVVYYVATSIYFIAALSLYAFLAGKMEGVKRFWRHLFLPATTALATCSSAVSLPVNMQAAKNMGISAQIYEMALPLGSMLHKDGSVLGGVVKIALLYGMFNMSLSSPTALLFALMISVLVGTVMGAIPSGGMIGEMLILSAYGFPPQTLIIIAAISIIADPLATMVNVTSNTACTMLIARLVDGKTWIKSPERLMD